jgi:nucleotide-binding universal stress UspA family protein
MQNEQIFSKILVSTDGSQSSAIAQELTAFMAKKLKSKVTVIHVIAHEPVKLQLQRFSSDYGFVPVGPSGIMQNVQRVSTPSTTLPESISNEIDDWYHQKGEKAIKEATSLFKEEGIPVDQKLIEHAEPAETIIKESKEGNYDLIVIGQGAEEEKETHLGSVAQKISHNSPTSVLIAREKRKISKILVPIDGSERSEKALQHAVILGKKVDAKITLLHVQEADFFSFRPEMAKKIGTRILSDAASKVKGIEVDQKLESGDPAKVVIQTAKKGDYDLIVMGSKGQSVIRRLLIGSVSDHVIHYTDRSVLLVR